MKRLAVFVLGGVLIAVPALTFAQSAVPLGPTPLQLLTGVASLEAQENSLENGQSLACSVAFATSSVAIGQNVDLAWGSVGAVDPELSSTTISMWAPQGGSVLNFSQAGTWTYRFTFYNQQNASVTCSAKIVVTKR